MSICTAVEQHIWHYISTKAKEQDNQDTETPFSGCWRCWMASCVTSQVILSKPMQPKTSPWGTTLDFYSCIPIIAEHVFTQKCCSASSKFRYLFQMTWKFTGQPNTNQRCGAKESHTLLAKHRNNKKTHSLFPAQITRSCTVIATVLLANIYSATQCHRFHRHR